MKTYYTGTDKIINGFTILISARGKSHAKRIIDKDYPEKADELKKNVKLLKAGDHVKVFSSLIKTKDK